jgi:hypothetical protein
MPPGQASKPGTNIPHSPTKFPEYAAAAFSESGADALAART